MKGTRSSVTAYLSCLIDPNLAPTALRVALIVGTILFTINHGTALIRQEMTRERWIAASLTYLIPYLVNIHGQYAMRSRKSETFVKPQKPRQL